MPLLQTVSTNFFIIAIVMQHIAASYKLSTEFCLVWNGVIYDFMINPCCSLSYPLQLSLSLSSLCVTSLVFLTVNDNVTKII